MKKEHLSFQKKPTSLFGFEKDPILVLASVLIFGAIMLWPDNPIAYLLLILSVPVFFYRRMVRLHPLKSGDGHLRFYYWTQIVAFIIVWVGLVAFFLLRFSMI
jgi:hypothetical protein